MSAKPNGITVQNFMLPYHFANEINAELKLATNDYINLVDSLQAAGGEKAQKRAFACFKKLSRDDLIERCSHISKLAALLKTIQKNAAP